MSASTNSSSGGSSGTSGSFNWNTYLNDITTYNDDVVIAAQDMAALVAELKKLKTMSPQEAFMTVLYTIFPMIMQTQESGVKVMADEENLDSDFRTVVSEDQNILNYAMGNQGQITAAQAQTFYNDITNMQNYIKNNPALSKQVKQQMEQAIQGIKGQFAVWSPSGIQAQFDQVDTKTMSQNFQDLNQNISSMTTVLGTSLQYQMKMYDSYQGSYSDVIKGYLNWVKAMVSNQKSS